MSRPEASPTPSIPAPAHTAPAGSLQRLHPADEATTDVLAIRLGATEYGIALRCVEAVRRYQPPTRRADNSQQVLGVVDWRDETVPLLDLRCRLGHAAEFGAQTAIVQIGLMDRAVGIIVDQVTGALSLAERQLAPLPPGRAGADRRYEIALGRCGSRSLVLLDLEALLRDAVTTRQPKLPGSMH